MGGCSQWQYSWLRCESTFALLRWLCGTHHGLRIESLGEGQWGGVGVVVQVMVEQTQAEVVRSRVAGFVVGFVGAVVAVVVALLLVGKTSQKWIQRTTGHQNHEQGLALGCHCQGERWRTWVSGVATVLLLCGDEVRRRTHQ